MYNKQQEDEFMPKSEPDPREVVRQYYPLSEEYDDGEKVRIVFRDSVTDECPHCGQMWTHKKNLFTILGSGGNPNAAWLNAANNLQKLHK